MKLYDYMCTKCGNVEERLVEIGKEEHQVCSCNFPMVRQVSAPGMVRTNFADKTGFKKRS